ncbi:unnamed protein product [Vicia faba]|uniref:ATP-grasp fold ATP-dependent carboxylate-amine ligase-type domain-containing protein n=1 Tax=Vicia faba TaxID=3906 RepID=A0AAV1ASB3_VICFA|nr:unnamed protein product [Vicia faba]
MKGRGFCQDSDSAANRNSHLTGSGFDTLTAEGGPGPQRSIEGWIVLVTGELFGYPLLIKSRRLAYDGRGNAVAKSEEELASAADALGGFVRDLYAEKWAPAVIVARGRDGTISCYLF